MGVDRAATRAGRVAVLVVDKGGYSAAERRAAAILGILIALACLVMLAMR